jgi:hypothetical protein
MGRAAAVKGGGALCRSGPQAAEGQLVNVASAPHGTPGIPSDPENHEGDPEANQRVSHRRTEGNGTRTCDHGEAHVGVCASVIAIGDQRGTREPLSSPRPDASS